MFEIGWSKMTLNVTPNFCWPEISEGTENDLAFLCFSEFCSSLEFVLASILFAFGPGGHLNVTWRGGAHFLRVSTARLGKTFAIWYPVSEFLDYKTMGKTIAFCSWTNSHIPFRNFWSIFIPRSGIYTEKWYHEKRQVPYRFIWNCPPPPGHLG